MKQIRLSPGPWTANWWYGQDKIEDANGKNVAMVRGRKDGINGPAIAAVPDLISLAQMVAAGNTDPASLAEIAQRILDNVEKQLPEVEEA